MVSGFICGTSSLSREEDDFYRQTRSADSSPRKHSKSRSSSKTNKNPYSSRGLDKFSALLAEIDEKRQKIYAQLNPDEISIVRFRYSPDHNIKPIVVKVKPNAKPESEPKADPPKPKAEDLNVANHGTLNKIPSSSTMAVENKREKARLQLREKVKGYKWDDPRFYLPVAIILILVSLVFFGRAFVIMCTSIGWYVIPAITNNGRSSSYLKRSFKKKDYTVRRLSNKKLMRKEGTVSFKGADSKSHQQK